MTVVGERKFLVKELAADLRLSRQTITKLFENEDGVLRFGKGPSRYRRKRPYVTLVIPESVVMRVLQRLKRNGRSA